MPLPARAVAWILVLVGAALGTAAITAHAQDGTPSVVAPAAGDGKARALMEEMLAAQRALKSYSATLEVVASEPQGGHKYVSVLAFKKPGRASVMTRGTEGESRVAADGRNLYYRFPTDKNRYHRQSLRHRRYGVVLALSHGVDKTLIAFLLGSPLEAFTFNPFSCGPSDQVMGVPVETVVATLPARESREETWTFALGKRDHLLRRVTREMKVNGQTGTWVATFSNVRANPPLPNARFAFSPAPGAKAVSPRPGSGT